jgi:hypothetical protein
MEAYHLWLGPDQHGQVFGAYLTHGARWLGHCSQPLRIEVHLQTRPHRLADVSGNVGLGPERIIDIEASAAQLLEASYSWRQF